MICNTFAFQSFSELFPYNVRNVLQIFQNILVFYYRKYVKYHSSQNPWNKLNLQTKNSAKQIDAMFRNRMKYASHMKFGEIALNFAHGRKVQSSEIFVKLLIVQ